METIEVSKNEYQCLCIESRIKTCLGRRVNTIVLVGQVEHVGAWADKWNTVRMSRVYFFRSYVTIQKFYVWTFENVYK